MIYNFFFALNCISYLTESYLFGFALFYLMFFFFRNSMFKTAFGIIPYIGLLYFFSSSFGFAVEFLNDYLSGVSYMQMAYLNPILNNVWLAIIFPILFVFLPTQLFWFKKIRNSKWIVLGLIYFFILSFERMYIFINSLQNDYLPPTWTMYSGNILFEILISVVLFLLITSLFHFKNEILSYVKTIFNLKLKNTKL